jgi:hypothetical protein
LVLRWNPETGELKTYLSNAPADTPLATLVRLCGMRWPIETCFETGKQYLGMGDYEVRSWRGWHHHMTLVILAHFFLVRMHVRIKKSPGADGAAGAPPADGGAAAPGVRCGSRTGAAGVHPTTQRGGGSVAPQAGGSVDCRYGSNRD